MKSQYKEYEEKFNKTVEAVKHEFADIRASRANAGILDKVHVDYYGVPTQINQMASISVQEARILVIQPYDASSLKNIEKAIQASNLGINPQNDGKTIRLVFPPLTEERRKEIVKGISKSAEDTKIAVRNIRREALEKFKDQKKKSEITEDDYKLCEKDMQEATDKYCAEIDKLAKDKEKEIMEI